MKKNNNDWILTLILSFGALWLLRRILENKTTPGIFGITFRKLITYEFNGKKVVAAEISNFTNAEAGIVIRAIMKASNESELHEPFFKRMKHGVKFTGELRPFPFRIFVHKLNEENWLVLHVFKKKKDDTDEKEIEIAERRLEEYRSRKK